MLARMGGTTTARVASLLEDPAAAMGTHAWASSLGADHRDALEL